MERALHGACPALPVRITTCPMEWAIDHTDFYFCARIKRRSQHRMNNELLWCAIENIRKQTPASDSRTATYLRTYPALIAAARCDVVDDTTRFLQLAAMTYGWMPRVLRL